MFALQIGFGCIMVVTAFIAVSLSSGSAQQAIFVKQAPTHYATGAVTPAARSPPAPLRTTRVLHRQSDGLFYLEARANGNKVRMVVDTGATMVVLNRADAATLGVAFEALTERGTIRTARGTSEMRWATVPKMDVLGRQFENVRAAVIDGPLPVSLMGQNLLTQLGKVTLHGDTLTLH